MLVHKTQVIVYPFNLTDRLSCVITLTMKVYYHISLSIVRLRLILWQHIEQALEAVSEKRSSLSSQQQMK